MANDVIVFTLGGIDFTPYTDMLSIQVTDGADASGDSCNFTVVLSQSQLAQLTPNSGQIISFSINGVKEFEGVITTVEQSIYQNLNSYIFACKAGDYTFLLTARVVTEALPAGNAGDIVTFLLNKYAPGFGTRYVSSGYVVPADKAEHEPLSTVISKYAQSVGYSWYVDFNREVHFSGGEAVNAPIPAVNLDTELRIGDLSIGEDVSQIKNRIYVTDATVKSASSRNDTFVADGNQSFFSLFTSPYDVASTSVTKNGQPVTIFEDPLTNQSAELEGVPGTAFICLINSGLRFPTNDLPAAGDIISANYFPEQSGGNVLISVEDPASIKMMRQRESSNNYLSSGIHEDTVSAPDVRAETYDPLAFIGNIALSRAAWPEITGKFIVQDQTVIGWRAGQTFTITSTLWNIYWPRALWWYGVRTPIRLYVQSVGKKFHPYQKSDGSFGEFFIETVNFSSVSGRTAF